MLPCTTKRRTTTNLKTNSNQNCQKIELYGSPTIKELKKKHSFRLIGAAELGSWSGEDTWQGSGWRTGQARWRLADRVPDLRVDNQEEQLGSKTDHTTQGSNMGN